MAREDDVPRETLYDVLSVSENATASEIRRAYKQQAILHHPDRNRHPDAKARFQQIAEAFEVLSDAGKRAAYDGDLRQETLRAREWAEGASGAGATARPADRTMFTTTFQEPHAFFHDPFFAPPRFARGSRHTDPFAVFDNFFNQHHEMMRDLHGDWAAPPPPPPPPHHRHHPGYPVFGAGFGPAIMGPWQHSWEADTRPLPRTGSTFSSTSIRIVNGVRTQTRHQRDETGRETVETIAADGTRTLEVLDQGASHERAIDQGVARPEAGPPARKRWWWQQGT